MLHRHFETEKEKNVTTLADVSGDEKKEFTSEIFPPDEAPKKRGRSKKTEEYNRRQR